GFGFIEGDDGDDYFVHVSGLRIHLRNRGLRKGQRILFDIESDIKGDRAVNVRQE
ncbi:MAG: cold-shock protein, partial [Candidatus Marinimicrobia bacterium]|nr:cold-shock protein [Candidatus Neomarinimicrobiota bacterium]